MPLTVLDETSADSLRATYVRNAIESRIQHSDDAILNAIDLRVTIEEFAMRSDLMLATLTVTGTVSGTNIDESFCHMRRDGGVQPVNISGATGFIVNAILYLAIKLTTKRGRSPTDEIERNHCLYECLGDVFQLLERLTWQPPTSLAMRWKLVQTTKWISSVAAFLAYSLVGTCLLSDKIPVVIILALGAICAGTLFLCMHLIGLILMPTKFFKTEQIGLKTLARTGIVHVGAMRIMMFLLAVPIAVVLVLLVMVAFF